MLGYKVWDIGFRVLGFGVGDWDVGLGGLGLRGYGFSRGFRI